MGREKSFKEFIQGVMVKSKNAEWQRLKKFFGNPENKGDSIKVVYSYCQKDEDFFEIPLSINSGGPTWRIAKKRLKSFHYAIMKKQTQSLLFTQR